MIAQQKAKISVDPSSLVTVIELENSSLKVTNSINLILTNNSDDITSVDNKFIVAWTDFRRALTSISRIFKNENVLVEFDEFSTKLVKEFIDDSRRLNTNESTIEIKSPAVQDELGKNLFERNLKIEQIRDTVKLLALKHGANFSVPGAGKTTTILAVHTLLKAAGKINKLFVVAPINAFISWEDEIRDIFKKTTLKIIRIRGSLINNYSQIEKENADVILINYEKLRKDIDYLIALFLNNKVHFVLDESHRIKSGSNNLSYNQIKRLADLSKRRDILSGTPMPQSYLDLQPQFDFLWPAKRIIPVIGTLMDESKIEEINHAIEKLFVRTTKKELDLGELIPKYTYIDLGPIQSELYKLFKSEAARIIAGMDRANHLNYRRMGKSVIRLLQASTNPMLLTQKDEYYDTIEDIPNGAQVWELLGEFSKFEQAAKIEYLKSRIAQILGEDPKNKVLVWSYFVRNIQLLERLLKDYNPVSIYGGVPTGSDEDENNREGRIRKFHEDNSCKIMIANPQACGEGISLHRVCHYAIYLDRNFNAAYYLQSIDRIHRLGLDKSIKTTVEVIIARNTVDELLIKRINEKIINMGNILNDKYLQSLAYDPADIQVEEELGLDKNDFEAIKQHVNS